MDNNKPTAEEKIRDTATAYFNTNYELMNNPQKDLVCIYQTRKTRPSDIYETISFVIYDPAKEEILFKETVPRAEIRWIDNEHFEVTTTPGRVRSEKKNRQGFVFDTRTRAIKRF